MSIHFLRLLLLAGLVALAKSTCNVCNTVNNLTCYSTTQVQACDADNLPTGVAYDCPTGYVCVSGTSGVLCEPEATASSTADCQDCNTCDSTLTFACTSTNTFALCLGTSTPQASVGTCADGYVCNINDSQICGLSPNVSATCSYADDSTTTTTTAATTTTTSTPSTSNAATYCAAVQQTGRFKVGDYTESTCRQYIDCFLLNGVWTGHKYTCPGQLYFSPTANLCVSSLPSNCYTPSSTTTTTTATPTVSNPSAYCAMMQTQDYFPVGTNPSSTCRQYIYCFLLNGSWLGHRYTCPGSLYWNSSSKTCVSTLPSTCSASVTSLSLNGVDLD
ncbi:mucin-5AC [Drosophila nasuta]|uniref:mucin-5AC n=1 Tax=Drosophila nasuta TaxID=42062 RepID=UPI00295F0E04|nr:mucin-5AC [Drosophila nasuta]